MRLVLVATVLAWVLPACAAAPRPERALVLEPPAASAPIARSRALWVPGHWRKVDRGMVWIEGHWA